MRGFLSQNLKKTIDDSKVENQKALTKVDTFSHQIQKEFEKALELAPSVHPFIWKIENFHTKFEQAKIENTLIRSPPFLCLNHYKGQLKLYLNGNGVRQDTHMSIFFCLLEGPFDDMIEWPMPIKKYAFELIMNDRVIGIYSMSSINAENVKKFKRPTLAETGNLGRANFIQLNDIPSVIQDDTATIKFEIH